jgi:hypothetical protein
VSNKRASRAKAVNKPALFLAAPMCTCSRSGGLASQMGALRRTGCVVFGSVARRGYYFLLSSRSF